MSQRNDNNICVKIKPPGNHHRPHNGVHPSTVAHGQDGHPQGLCQPNPHRLTGHGS